MSPLMFGIGISLSTSSSMSKTMAIACRRYKGEREAGCEQVIFYFIKYLRHWLISIFIFFQSSTKRWLPLTYHQAYLRLCRTSVRVATALCAVDLKGSGGPGKGNVKRWLREKPKKRRNISIYKCERQPLCATAYLGVPVLWALDCDHLFCFSHDCVCVVLFMCAVSSFSSSIRGERDGKKRKERKRGKS